MIHLLIHSVIVLFARISLVHILDIFFKSGEMLAMRLAVIHNIYFYNTLMIKIREALKNDEFDKFYNEYVEIIGRRI